MEKYLVSCSKPTNQHKIHDICKYYVFVDESDMEDLAIKLLKQHMKDDAFNSADSAKEYEKLIEEIENYCFEAERI